MYKEQPVLWTLEPPHTVVAPTPSPSPHATDNIHKRGRRGGNDSDPFLFLNFATIISLELVELGTSNFMCWLNTQEY